ncbi:MAG: hypothetical protein NTX30_05135, partial [Deltaproteobacteria bacterium]|nr:hypothetical protein [Deltaproteobacteria bacterium]
LVERDPGIIDMVGHAFLIKLQPGSFHDFPLFLNVAKKHSRHHPHPPLPPPRGRVRVGGPNGTGGEVLSSPEKYLRPFECKGDNDI